LISQNHLTGEVPKELGYLLGLVSLNLSRNNLHGQIPSEIGNLNSLEFLDLSRNHISGKIPSTLSKIDRLAVLELSNNDLNGRIPWGRQLQTFDGSSFEGNADLCGQQLNKSCPGDKPIGTPEGAAVDGEDEDSIFYGALYTSLGLGFFTGFWGFLGLLRANNTLASMENCLPEILEQTHRLYTSNGGSEHGQVPYVVQRLVGT